MESIKKVHTAAKFLADKKGIDIAAINIRDLTTIADYFLIASGSSPIQVKALSDSVEDGLAALGLEPRRIEGYQSGMWVVLDYYDVVVHIFNEQSREFYALERLWADAPRVELDLNQ